MPPERISRFGEPERGRNELFVAERKRRFGSQIEAAMTMVTDRPGPDE